MRAEIIPLTAIIVPADRQRSDKSIEDLLPSIKKRGIVTPIIVSQLASGEVELIAGERRLLCAKALGITHIFARFLEHMSDTEKQIIELEENLHRKELDWRDFALSVKQIHELYLRTDSSWQQLQTAESINISPSAVSKILAVAEEIASGNKKILSCPGWSPAFNIIARLNQRRADNAFNELMEEPHARESKTGESKTASSSPDPSTELPVQTQSDSSHSDYESILNGDFISWAASYKGPLFNFVHCDFPYGIGLERSDQGYSSRWGGYSDGASKYWDLCEALTRDFERLFAPSSHLMFWLSADYTVISTTVNFFESRTDLHFNPKPLIWHKSDNRGILPDPKRGPRHVYETAIFASRGDRLICSPVADTYSSPAGDKTHQSEKSESMLRHFFRMFVSDGTRFLDGTCGTGSSLRAAESLGAEATGIELSPEWAEHGRELLKKSRLFRKYEEKKHGLP